MDVSSGNAQGGPPPVDPFSDALPGGVPSESQEEFLRCSFFLNENPGFPHSSAAAAVGGNLTVDPFADTDPGGVLPESQEELLRRSSFLNETPRPLSSSSAGRGCASLPIPVADRPILICSLPGSPADPSTEEPRPAAEKPQPTPGCNLQITKSKNRSTSEPPPSSTAQGGRPPVDPFSDALPGGVPSESQEEFLRRSFFLNETPRLPSSPVAAAAAAAGGALTVDPFADTEPGGVLSESQEELLRRSSFLNETPRLPSSSCGGRGCASLPIPVADRPILICSLPDSAADPSTEEHRPAAEQPQPTSGCNLQITKSKKPSPWKMKSRAAGPSPEETPGRWKNPQSNGHQSLEVLKEALGCQNEAPVPVSGRRVLPVTMRDPQSEEERRKGSGSTSRGRENPPLVSDSAANPVDDSAFTANLLDVLTLFAEKPDKKFHDIDILEIAMLKQIEFPPPKWWRPGGYGPGF